MSIKLIRPSKLILDVEVKHRDLFHKVIDDSSLVEIILSESITTNNGVTIDAHKVVNGIAVCSTFDVNIDFLNNGLHLRDYLNRRIKRESAPMAEALDNKHKVAPPPPPPPPHIRVVNDDVAPLTTEELFNPGDAPKFDFLMTLVLGLIIGFFTGLLF